MVGNVDKFRGLESSCSISLLSACLERGIQTADLRHQRERFLAIRLLTNRTAAQPAGENERHRGKGGKRGDSLWSGCVCLLANDGQNSGVFTLDRVEKPIDETLWRRGWD